MCRWRQIQDTYAHCGHMYRLPDEMVQLGVPWLFVKDLSDRNPLLQVYCPEKDCKFSPFHPPDCGPNCTTTCWQYRRFPEQIERRLDRLCPSCQRAENERLAALAAQSKGYGGQAYKKY